MILQDIAAGRGVMLLDPHGDLVERVVLQVPHERYPDLIYFNVPDGVEGDRVRRLVGRHVRSLAASGMLEAFGKLWPDYWGPRMEYIPRNALFTLLRLPNHAVVLKLMIDGLPSRPFTAETLRYSP